MLAMYNSSSCSASSLFEKKELCRITNPGTDFTLKPFVLLLWKVVQTINKYARYIVALWIGNVNLMAKLHALPTK